MTTDAQKTAEPQTQYERDFVHMMDDIDALIDATTNPLHRKILINYRRHGLLEVAGRYDELLAPEMTVRHPQYRMFEGGESVILDGMDQVRNFYETLADVDMLVMWTGNQKISVGDYGFSGEAEFNQFVPGKMLGDNVFSSLSEDDEKAESAYDPDAYYLVRRTLAFFWPYDETGKMIGEHVYEDSASKVVTRVETSEVITGQRAAELLNPIIDKYELPQ